MSEFAPSDTLPFYFLKDHLAQIMKLLLGISVPEGLEVDLLSGMQLLKRLLDVEQPDFNAVCKPDERDTAGCQSA